jgi:hypothetical protein
MAWSFKGSYVETCSCDLICPCNARALDLRVLLGRLSK